MAPPCCPSALLPTPGTNDANLQRTPLPTTYSLSLLCIHALLTYSALYLLFSETCESVIFYFSEPCRSIAFCDASVTSQCIKQPTQMDSHAILNAPFLAHAKRPSASPHKGSPRGNRLHFRLQTFCVKKVPFFPHRRERLTGQGAKRQIDWLSKWWLVRT